MKKFFSIIILSFLFLTPSISETIGEGELKLSDRKIEYFKKYLSGKGNTKPGTFLITTDGSYATYWYCGGQKCQVGNERDYIKKCEISAGNGKKCKVFARVRYIKWKNGINPGKGKISKINSKLSFNELKAKLTELGFVGEITSSITSSSSSNNSAKIKITYPESLFIPSEVKKKEWVEFNKYGEGTDWPHAVWAEVRRIEPSKKYSFQWSAQKSLKKSLKKALDGCDKRLKEKKKDFKNSEICIVHYINGKETTNNEKIKFAENHYGKKIASLSFEKNPWILNKNKKKVTKKYELKGERSIALSWDGYESLIAGTVNFDESDYKGNIDLPLPNNDGICEGTYSLQEGGKGTWQIACTNNMGAAGTLKWIKEGGVTGIGRDHNDKKVKFTVSKKS